MKIKKIKDWFTPKNVKEERKREEAYQREIRRAEGKIHDYLVRMRAGSIEEIRLVYADLYDIFPMQKNQILYESYGGRGLICSPYAIFKCFLKRPDFKDYMHIWVLEDNGMNKYLMKEYKDYENVKFVWRDTYLYAKDLCESGVLITNLSFPNYFIKRSEQIYINTWHGIPLKTLGFDIPDGRITGLNTIRNFLAVDVFLSPNRFMTDIFKSAFSLEGLYEGRIMESGMPRTDNLFHTEPKEVYEKFERAPRIRINPDKKLILYAPTWKGEKYSAPDTDTQLYFDVIKAVEENIDTNKYQVLVKPHQIVYKYMIENMEDLTEKFIPAVIDPDELLSITDVLISDYSSIYFDFLATGRPILFYIPDLEEYKTSRGLYFGVDKLPGPIAENPEQLGEMIRDIPSAVKPYEEKYKSEREWACPNDDGNVCNRVIDKLIVNRDFSGLISCNYTDKKKLLLYTGGLKTEKMKNKLDEWVSRFNFEKYDLTFIVPHNVDMIDWIRSVDRRVRVLRRTGTHAANEEELVGMEMMSKHEKDDYFYERVYKEYYYESIYRREARRILGQTHFDYAVDYSQKSQYYMNIFQSLKDTKILEVDELDMFLY